MSLIDTIRFITGHPLNRHRRVDALACYVKWQIESRLSSGEIVHEWVNGARFRVRSGETGLTGNIYAGLHEFADMGFLLHALRPEDLFVDVGANAGSYTLLACSAIGATGIAFEPIPATYERLAENIRLNDLEDSVTSINKGLGAELGTLRFTSGHDTTNHVLAPGEDGSHTIEVEVSTLDAELRGRHPLLMKIDVEGYETAVLQGATETLAGPDLHAVIMEVNPNGRRYGFDESRTLELMRDHGFERFSYDPFVRRLVSLDDRSSVVGNTLFIRRRAFIEERLRSSPKLAINGRQF